MRHPAKFVLIGSGNPEEGELRPQLLDRFGLSVEVKTPQDIEQRIEIMRRCDAQERDAAAFALSRMGNESALPLLVKASQDNKKAVRLKAVKGLEVLAGEGSAWAVKVLEKIFHEDEEGMADYFTLISEEHRINDLAHPDYNIRIIAVKNLVRTADPSRLPALKESLANERDNYVKATIIKAI